MTPLRIGIVGAGGMGMAHAAAISELGEFELAGLCDVDHEKVEAAAAKIGVPAFTDHAELIRADRLDAVLVATPHYFHPPVVEYAFANGLHVMCEKPIAVHVRDAQRMIDAHAGSGVQFGVMFQMRTNPLFRTVHELVASGALGELQRTNWIITNWYRPQAYYDMGGWRGTWKGEGGGVLINQCPHQLDLMQWICGMPVRVRAHCRLGARHDIEVEDDVTAVLEYANGATGVFVTSTGEAPGANRFEIVGALGTIIVENDKVRYLRTAMSVREHIATTDKSFATVDIEEVDVPIPADGGSYIDILTNFAAAIRDPEVAVAAPGSEAINQVTLQNAMLMSGLQERPIELPLDADAYVTFLDELIASAEQ